MIQLIWLTIALPLVGFLVNGIFGRRLGYQSVRFIGPLAVLGSFLVGVGAFFEVMGHEEGITVPLWTWAIIGDMSLEVSLLYDQLAALMVLIITGVGFLIHVYATEYMVHRDKDGHVHPDPYFPRFFTFLNLFVASMLILVLGDNYLMMFVGWELVGACSYLLIGFWFDRGEEEQTPVELGGGKKPVQLIPLLSPAASGMKAFVVNRIGDFGFALGIFLIWSTFGTLQYLGENGVFEQAEAVHAANPQIITWIALLLFVGAMGKSAQIPLYVWLPDAMAGPTPVSALIHAATMVTAGIYMIVRSHVLYMLAPDVSFLVATIGAVTALGAGTIAITQVDLKRVLAYSTVSQLGYMFLAVGVGAYTVGMFHLTTHAFFKALLFLGAGSVMHALHDVIDLRRMGGLKDKMPVTYWTFLIGGLALAGFPLTSGFFSKDEILVKAYEASFPLYIIGVITALLTAIYTFRAIFLAFHGKPRDQHLYDHAHESGSAVTIPLGILAVLALFAGFLGLPHITGLPNLFEIWLEPIYLIHKEAHYPPFAVEMGLIATSSIIAIGGIGLAYFLYMVKPSIPQAIARNNRTLFDLLINKYYIDERVYGLFIVTPTTLLAKFLAKEVDKDAIDKGLVDGTGRLAKSIGSSMSHLQSGYLRHYALATFMGVLVMVSYFFFR